VQRLYRNAYAKVATRLQGLRGHEMSVIKRTATGDKSPAERKNRQKTAY
jgi:hypothetical protein